MYQAHPLPSTWRTGKILFPDLTPVTLTLALALERFAGTAHASAAIRAHAIQDAGYHV
jgi:hypothetical protein